jgi:hypothetical protein
MEDIVQGVSEETQEEVSEEIIPDYDPVDHLVNRRFGIECPNCKDTLFPLEDSKEARNCKCGITYILGGKHLRYRVGVPYVSADARVVSERVDVTFEEGEEVPTTVDDQLTLDIAEELGDIVNDGATVLDEIIEREPQGEVTPDLPETSEQENQEE